MKKCLACAICLILGLLSTYSLFATECGEYLDQSNTCVNTYVCSYDQWQSFTAGMSGLLTKIMVQQHGCRYTSFRLFVYSGEGRCGSLLFAQDYCFGFVNDGQWLCMNIPEAYRPSVTSGSTYTFRILASCSVSLDASSYNPYSGGRYSSYSCYDLAFKTYVDNTDYVSPVALCRNITVNLDATGHAHICPGDIDNGSYDNEGIVERELSQYDFSCCNIGANNVILEVEDRCDNEDECTAVVTVRDNMAPVVSCTTAVVRLNSNGVGYLCADQVDNGSWDNCGIRCMTVSPSRFTCANLGRRTVVLTCTDYSGNTSSCETTINVVDCTPPTTLCRSGVEVRLNANGQGFLNVNDIDNNSTDNCGIIMRYLYPQSFCCRDVGNQTVTLTCWDAAGNMSQCTTTVRVRDVTAPVALCRASLTVNLNSNGYACLRACDVNYGSYDNCGIASMSLSPSEFRCCDVGTRQVVLTCYDADGNSAQCTTYVQVRDVTAPTALCRSGVVINLNSDGIAYLCAEAVDNGSFDNCGITDMSVYPNTFRCCQAGRHQVVLTCVDAAGNSSQCTTCVTVRDVTPPVVNCLDDIEVYLNANGQGCLRVADVNDGSYDNCGIVSMSIYPSSFDCGDVGENVPVVLTCWDAAGNSASCTTYIEVEDEIAPTISVSLCPNTLTPANCTWRYITATVNVSDNCCGTTYELYSICSNQDHIYCDVSDASYGTNDRCFYLKAKLWWCATRYYYVTYKATDASGNVSYATATVTVPYCQPREGEPDISLDMPDVSFGIQNIAPNPLTSSTTISYLIPQTSNVTIEIFNSIGERVATLVNTEMKEGSYDIVWEGLDSKGTIMPSGVYICKVTAGQYVSSKNIMVLR